MRQQIAWPRKKLPGERPKRWTQLWNSELSVRSRSLWVLSVRQVHPQQSQTMPLKKQKNKPMERRMPMRQYLGGEDGADVGQIAAPEAVANEPKPLTVQDVKATGYDFGPTGSLFRRNLSTTPP